MSSNKDSDSTSKNNCQQTYKIFKSKLSIVLSNECSYYQKQCKRRSTILIYILLTQAWYHMYLLYDALKIVTQASQQGKRQAIVRPINPVVIEFFKMMQKNNYIQDFTVIDDRRGRINNCSVISPRFDVSAGELEQWTNRLLPSRLFGYVVLTTSDGIMDHREAQRKNIGGKIIGYFY